MSATDGDAGRGGEGQRQAYRLRWRRALAAGLSLAAGTILGLALPAGGSPGPEIVDENIHLPDPIEALKQAEAVTPYPVRLPRTLPPGAKLELLVWDTPETVEQPGRWDVLAWYRLATGGKLHVWQTNAPEATTWIEDYEPVTIDGYGWKLQRIPPSQLGRLWFDLGTTFPDGVSFGVGAYADEVPLEVLMEVAASVRPTEPQAAA